MLFFFVYLTHCHFFSFVTLDFQVVQLYLGYPESAGEPLRQLRAFSKVALDINTSDILTNIVWIPDLGFSEGRPK
jgi:hypothetical protein